MKTWLALCVLTGAACNANAGDVFVKYGFGAEGAVVPKTEIRTIDFGYHGGIGGGLCWAANLGYFWDNGIDHSAAYGFVGLGPRVEPADWFYIENLFSIGAVARHEDDPLLGGHFQFAIDLGVGFKTPLAGTTIGLALKHISNAGIRKPNHGRDFLTLHVGIPL